MIKAHNFRAEGKFDSANYYIQKVETALNFNQPGYFEIIYYQLKGDLQFEKKKFTQALDIHSQKDINSVEIFNLLGQRVQQHQKIENGQINLSKLISGVYIIRLTLENGQIETFKVVKK